MSDTMIMDAIASHLVLPNRLTVPLVADLHVAQLRSPLPRVTVSIMNGLDKTRTHTEDLSQHISYKHTPSLILTQQIHKCEWNTWTSVLWRCSWTNIVIYFLCVRVFSCMSMHMLGSCAYPPAWGRGPDCQGHRHQRINWWEVRPLRRSACRNPDLHLSSRRQQSKPAVAGDVWGERRSLDIQVLHFAVVCMLKVVAWCLCPCFKDLGLWLYCDFAAATSQISSFCKDFIRLFSKRKLQLQR